MMRRPMLGGIVLAAILAAGCSGSQPVQPYVANEHSVDTLPQSSTHNGVRNFRKSHSVQLYVADDRAAGASAESGTYRKIHDFGSGADGRFPVGALIKVGKRFYGASYYGGKNDTGTVFSVTEAGAVRVLHSFSPLADHSDGQIPAPGTSLLNVNGTLYGTTSFGGRSKSSLDVCCGIIYSISLNGTEKVAYNFRGDSGGQFPFAGLLNVNGILYGTTNGGGAYNTKNSEAGTAFAFNPATGTARILHNFGQRPDGRQPYTSLIEVSGTLFSVTATGGPRDLGTIYSLKPSGAEQVLYNFAGSKDGATPECYSGLLDVNGTLYGTALNGGTYDAGVVFSITPAGTERVLHVFGSISGDGLNPAAGLINVNGTFYGTTTQGGQYDWGTIFSITPDGTEHVLHNFGRGNDGRYPQGALLYANGTLYGTTTWGGKYETPGAGDHSGTVFALTLPK